MKKILSLAILTSLLILAGCSGSDTWKPESTSQEIRPYVERAIEIIDSYLGFDISAEQANTAFTELYSRLEPLGVTDTDSSYSFVDRTAVLAIMRLSHSDFTDTEYRETRDILAYQIGESVSGKAFPVKKDLNIFEDEQVPEALRDFDAPAYSSSVFEFSDGYHFSLYFDAINGIAPSDLLTYANTIIDSVLKVTDSSHKTSFNVHIGYNYYEQTVFGLYLQLDDKAFSGHLIGGTDLAVSFESADEIADVIEAGAKYLGKHSVPEGKQTAQEESTTDTPETQVFDYPNTIGTDAEKLLTPILPDKLFGSTAEENGLGGTLYQIYGTVTDIVTDSDGSVDIHLHTHKGNIVITNLVQSMVNDPSMTALGTFNQATIDSLCPTPKKGEFCRIFAEYQGFSEKYQAPCFIYGSTSFISDVLITAVDPN